MKQRVKKVWAGLFGRKFDGTTTIKPKAILVNGDIISKVEIMGFVGADVWAFRGTKSIEELRKQFDVVAYIDGDFHSNGYIVASGINLIARGELKVQP